jgi:hypothetical protein
MALEFIARESLHRLAKRHDISRNRSAVWAARFEAGACVDGAREGHSAHTRKALQYSRPRSVHNVPTLIPPPSFFAETLIPPQPSSFGQTKPARQALTPSKAEQPDPKSGKMPAY